LAGLAITSLANAGLGLLLNLASDAQLRSLTFWMLGSLDGQSLSRVGVGAILMIAPILLAVRWSSALDALLLGEAEALHLGVPVERLKRRALAAAALATGASVALAGVIGFVGLLVPHLVRLRGGPSHALLFPRALLLGPCLVLAADLGARTALAPRELPIGVLTGLLGAPFFLVLLRRHGGEAL
ncbi:MAG: iron chelate uptake ABC transporter family permease subunit, partial [Myxococcota bacterium]